MGSLLKVAIVCRLYIDALHLPFFVLFEQESTKDRVITRPPRSGRCRVGAPLDLAVEALKWINRVDFRGQ